MNDDAKSAPNDNPRKEGETTELHLGRMAPGSVPRPEDIRRYRRLKREAIQKTLEKALRYARTKVAEAWSPSNPFRAESSAPAPLFSGRREETHSLIRGEASDRIDKTTFMDGMSM